MAADARAPGAIHEAASAAAPKNSACSMGRVFRPRGSLSSRVTCLRWSTISSEVLFAFDYRWASSSSQAKGERATTAGGALEQVGADRIADGPVVELPHASHLHAESVVRGNRVPRLAVKGGAAAIAFQPAQGGLNSVFCRQSLTARAPRLLVRPAGRAVWRRSPPP